MPKNTRKPAAAKPARKPSGIMAKVAEANAAKAAQSAIPHIEGMAYAGTGKTTTAVEGIADVKGVPARINPSPQQRAIWDALKVGKTDTIRMNSFGRDIARAMQAKLAERGLDRMGVEASTFHSMGVKAINRTLGRFNVNEWAVQELTAKAMGYNDTREARAAKDKSNAVVLSAVDSLVSLVKQNLAETDPETLDTLAFHYDVDTGEVKDRIFDLVPQVLEQARNPRGDITFDDMIWLPVIHNLPIQKVDLQIVDEAQDLNRMQQELAYRGGHRIMYIGDRHQAIYGFAGADATSMDRMREALSNVQTLPLTVTRRCGRAIVAEAQQWVPDFQAHEGNSDGLVRTAPWSRDADEQRLPWDKTWAAEAKDGDFVLCRVNAPLVSEAFSFIKRGVRANILGRDIGRGLTQLVNKLAGEVGVNTVQFVGLLSDWHTREVAKEEAKKNPRQAKIQALTDRYDTLLAFADGVQHTDEIKVKINNIFTDYPGRGVTFSSIHKAKGLEAERVFYLQPPKTPGTPGLEWWEAKLSAWQREQENNLRYVAVTRAKDELIYVR